MPDGNPARALELPPAAWLQPSGEPVTCADKIATLNRNLAELQQVAQDALEDGLLMGVDETQLRALFRAVIDRLENPYG